MKNLENIDIFRGMELKEIEELLKKIVVENLEFEKGDIVFFRDDELEGLYIVKDGVLSAEMLKDSGGVQKIENLESGSVIASAFIFGKNNRVPVDLIAVKKSELLFIDKKNLLKGFRESEKFLKNYLDDISDKAQFLSNKIWKNFNSKTIRDKIWDYIIEHKKEDEIEIKSIKELAEMFAVSRPSLSRVLSDFVNENILERIEKNKFKIIKKNIDEF